MIRNIALFTMCLSATVANADRNRSVRTSNEPAAIDGVDLFVPNGFDSNDEVVVVLDGYLPNSCYRLTQASVDVNESTREIRITQMARRFPGPCIVPLVPFTTVIEVGMLEAGNYQVITNSGRLEASLTIASATSNGAYGPDDFLYAPVDSVSVSEARAGEYTATISGRLTNNCMEFEEVKVLLNDRVIELLPILGDLTNQNCVVEDRPYSREVALPKSLQSGRNLVHVRSLNGSSKNAVFSAK